MALPILTAGFTINRWALPDTSTIGMTTMEEKLHERRPMSFMPMRYGLLTSCFLRKADWIRGDLL
jgi:hypothetical protein